MSRQNRGRRDGKKPSAIIDVKATEVRGTDSKPASGEAAGSDQKPAATPQSGKPSGTAQPSSTSAKSQPTAKPQASTPKSMQTEAAQPSATAYALRAHPDAKSRKVPTAAAATPSRKSAAPSSASASATRAATASAATASSAQASAQASKGSSTGSGGGTPRAPSGGGSGSGKSGGSGFFGTLTHLLAAVIGGGIVLLFGEQLAEQAGLPIPQREARVPDELLQRVASLETKTTEAASGGSGSAPDAGADEIKAVTDAQSQEIAALKQQLADLAKAQEASSGSAQGTAGGSGGDPAELLAPVQQRLDKLEQTIASVSKAAESGEGGTGANVGQLTALASQMSNMQSALDEKIAALSKSSTDAQSGAEKAASDLASTRTDLAKLAQRADAADVQTGRLDETLRALKETTAQLTADVKGLRGDLSQELAKVARPGDVKAAVAPIEEKVGALEKDVSGIVANEGDRKQNAERIVLALQLANLKRALDRGGSFAAELDDVRSVAGDSVDLSALETFKAEGVPTANKLASDFNGLSHDLISAETDDPNAGFLDKMLQGARSIVKVRRTGESADVDPNSAEAVVAQLDKQLKAGNLAAAAETADKLPEKAKAAAGGFVKRLKARAAVDKAIAAVEAQLKSSLSGGDAEAGNKS